MAYSLFDSEKMLERLISCMTSYMTVRYERLTSYKTSKCYKKD